MVIYKHNYCFFPPYTCTHTLKLFSIFLFIFCMRNKFVYIFPCFKWNDVDFITICDPFGVCAIQGRCRMCGKTIGEKSNILRAGKGDSWRDWHWALILGASPRSSRGKYFREQSHWRMRLRVFLASNNICLLCKRREVWLRPLDRICCSPHILSIISFVCCHSMACT